MYKKNEIKVNTTAHMSVKVFVINLYVQGTGDII